MAVYISILRGINVSGKNLIKMELLRQMYEQLHFNNVRSYIQSGNLVFEAKETATKKLATLIAKEIQNKFGFKVPVLVLKKKELMHIIQNNPFLKDKEKMPNFLHVTFLSSEVKLIDIEEITSKKQENEAIEFHEKAIYLFCPNGYGNTKLNNNFLERKLGVTATTRNWKTTLKLLDMTAL